MDTKSAFDRTSSTESHCCALYFFIRSIINRKFDYINNKEANAETANEKNINNGSGNPIP